MRSFITPALVALLTAAGVAGAQAQTYNATGTIYVSAKGEGTTTQGKSIRTASSIGDPGFESFGIVDFSGIQAPVNTSSISSISLTLLNYPAAYDISGPLDFFLTDSTSPLTANEGYTFQSGSTASDGIGTQLGTLSNLGTTAYSAAEAQSTLDTFTFTLNSAQKSLLLQDLAAGDVKFAIGTNSASATTAQFDGLGFQATPTLTLNTGAPVPEASTTASFGLLLFLGFGGIVVARRRKQA